MELMDLLFTFHHVQLCTCKLAFSFACTIMMSLCVFEEVWSNVRLDTTMTEFNSYLGVPSVLERGVKSMMPVSAWQTQVSFLSGTCGHLSPLGSAPTSSVFSRRHCDRQNNTKISFMASRQSGRGWSIQQSLNHTPHSNSLWIKY